MLVDSMAGEEHWVIVDHVRHLVPAAPNARRTTAPGVSRIGAEGDGEPPDPDIEPEEGASVSSPLFTPRPKLPPTTADKQLASVWAAGRCAGGRDRIEDAGCVDDLAELITTVRMAGYDEGVADCNAAHVTTNASIGHGGLMNSDDAKRIQDLAAALAKKLPFVAPELLEEKVAGYLWTAYALRGVAPPPSAAEAWPPKVGDRYLVPMFVVNFGDERPASARSEGAGRWLRLDAVDNPYCFGTFRPSQVRPDGAEPGPSPALFAVGDEVDAMNAWSLSNPGPHRVYEVRATDGFLRITPEAAPSPKAYYLNPAAAVRRAALRSGEAEWSASVEECVGILTEHSRSPALVRPMVHELLRLVREAR